MNQKNHKLLHYVLIILLMFAPLRSAFAMESSHCDMDGDMSSMSAQSMSPGMQVNRVQDNSQTEPMNHEAMNHEQMNLEQMNHDCCCCDNGCNSNCEMGTTASLLIQVSSYSPVFIKTDNIFISSPELQLRTLTPPSRPPLTLS